MPEEPINLVVAWRDGGQSTYVVSWYEHNRLTGELVTYSPGRGPLYIPIANVEHWTVTLPGPAMPTPIPEEK